MNLLRSYEGELESTATVTISHTSEIENKVYQAGLLTFGKINPCSWCRDRSWQRPALHSERSCKRKLSTKEENYKVYLGEHPEGSLLMKRDLEKGWGVYGLSLTFSLYASSFIWVPVVWQRVDWLSSVTATDEADIVTYSRYSLSYYIDTERWWKAVGLVDDR